MGAGGASGPQAGSTSAINAAIRLRIIPGAYLKPGQPPRQGAARSSKVPGPMARLRFTLSAALALLALALPACNRETTCSSEVTQGSGTYRGSTSGTRFEADLRRESLRIACGQLCAAGGPANTSGCVGRCAVDAEAGKIGARTSCHKGGSPR